MADRPVGFETWYRQVHPRLGTTLCSRVRGHRLDTLEPTVMVFPAGLDFDPDSD